MAAANPRPPQPTTKSASFPLFSWLTLGLAGALVIYPLLQPGLPGTADGPLHLMRAVELDAALRTGVLYPRWAPDLAFGYGFPIFNYYAPLLYYVIEIPHLLGFDLESALRLVVFATVLLYGVAAYWWARPILGEAPAAIAGVAYIFVPFRFLEAYFQGDYPQFLALALAPLALGAVYRFLTAERLTYRHILFLVVTLGALILVHNISTLLLAPVIAGYAVVVAAAEYPLRRGLTRLVLAAGVAVLAVGGTAFFWLPALAEQNEVQLYKLNTNDFDVRNHFTNLTTLLTPPRVLDQTLGNPPLLNYLGWPLLALVAVLAALLAYRLIRWRSLDLNRQQVAHLAIGAILFVGSTAMTLPISAPVWRRVPLLAYTEFPTRTLGEAALGLALLSGLAAAVALGVARDHGVGGQPLRTATSVIVLGFLAVIVAPSLVYLYPLEPFQDFPSLTPAAVIDFERTVGAVGTTSTGEYYPRDVIDRPTAPLPPDVATAGHLDRASLPSGSRVTFLGRSGYAERYDLNLPAAATVTFDVVRYPGWIVSVDGQSILTRPSPRQGLLTADVPAGQNTVTINFVDTPIRQLAWAISLTAGLVVIGVGLWSVVWRRGRREDERDLPPGPFPALSSPSIPPFSEGSPQQGECGAGKGVRGLGLSGLQSCLLLLVLLGLRITSPAPYAAVFARRSPVDRPIGISHPLQVQLGDQIELLGYDIDRESVVPGGQLTVTLYWRALRPLTVDYHSLAMVAHLGDEGLVAQDDRRHPGGVPTHAWSTDKYIADEKTITIPPTVPAMAYQLQAALYDPKTQLHLRHDGVPGSGGNQVTLQYVHVVNPTSPLGAGYQSAGNPVFDGSIALVGYKVQADHARPGGSIDLTLVWSAKRPIGRDYTVFTHVLNATQDQIAGKDSMPDNGEYPTSAWLVGEDVVDVYTIPLPPNVAPGTYHLVVGLYDATTMKRLDATAPGWETPRNQVDLELPVVVDAP